MNLNFIGIGGAFCPELGNNSAYIEENGKLLFIDLGLNTFSKIVKYNLVNENKKVYVLITHLHGDHVGGLPTFIQYVSAFFNIKVNIINSSKTLTKNITKILDLTGVDSSSYEFININDLTFSFKMELKQTTHTPKLECYSIIFKENNNNILYTSDSNDFAYLKEKVSDKSFTKIYSEVGASTVAHISYDAIKTLNKEKLILMHIESENLYKQIVKDGYKTPLFLK